MTPLCLVSVFFCHDTAPTEIYTLSLHDALPICRPAEPVFVNPADRTGHRQHLVFVLRVGAERVRAVVRSEEHTSELQSHSDLVCRLLLEKKKCSSMRSESCNSPRGRSLNYLCLA